MTKQQAERVIDGLTSVNIGVDDGTTLGHNIAMLIRECISDIRDEIGEIEGPAGVDYSVMDD